MSYLICQNSKYIQLRTFLNGPGTKKLLLTSFQQGAAAGDDFGKDYIF
jgi:hypothetical protein